MTTEIAAANKEKTDVGLPEKKDSKDLKRFCLFPIQYPELFDLFNQALNTFWSPYEIHLADDINDWKTLSPNEQFYIKYTLAFFASSDNIVAENVMQKFLGEVTIPEMRLFYQAQAMQEAIHSVTYNMLIEALVSDLNERNQLFFAIETHPMIKNKSEWTIRWMNSDASFAQRLIAFAAVETIFFSSAFCSIFWVKKRGKMHGLTFSNEMISRDEALHCKAAWKLYELLPAKEKLSEKELHTLIDDAVQTESLSVRESLPVSLIGMNADLMIEYVKVCADFLLNELGSKPLYNASNPFNWMNIGALGKVNFFERKNADYVKTSGTLTQQPHENDKYHNGIHVPTTVTKITTGIKSTHVSNEPYLKAAPGF